MPDRAPVYSFFALTMDSLQTDYSTALYRYACIQRFNVVSFYSFFLLVILGLVMIFAGLETAGGVIFFSGFAILGIILLESYFVLPFLKCPKCNNPFFVHKGFLGLIGKINPHNRKCIHCGLSVDDRLDVDDSNKSTE